MDADALLEIAVPIHRRFYEQGITLIHQARDREITTDECQAKDQRSREDIH